jgi:segregation and condensation protein B
MPRKDAPPKKPASPPPAEPLVIEPPDEDAGLSLEDLGQAYAALMQTGADPYQEPRVIAFHEADSAERTEATNEPIQYEPLADEGRSDAADDTCEVSPRSILEAMLFVGSPDNRPLTSEEIAAFMRGVTPAEIDGHVQELNAAYAEQGCPYEVVSVANGYVLTLRTEFGSVREQFYGRIREARLNQSAVDVLSIVAYHQPITADEVEKLRGRPSGGVLGQLVRRDLLAMERPAESPKKPRYRTTARFLSLFGIESLADLPRSQDAETMN